MRENRLYGSAGGGARERSPYPHPVNWSLPISPVAGHRMIEYFGANLPSGADIIQALQPKPDRLGARLPVPLASKKTAQARHHPNGVPEAGGLRRRHRILADETHQSVPWQRLRRSSPPSEWRPGGWGAAAAPPDPCG